MAMSMLKAQAAFVGNQAERVPIETSWRTDRFGTQTNIDTGRRKKSIVKETRT